MEQRPKRQRRRRKVFTVSLDPVVAETLDVYVIYSQDQKVTSRVVDRALIHFFRIPHVKKELIEAIRSYVIKHGEAPKFTQQVR